MQQEMDSIKKNSEAGEVVKHKARLVARDFVQQEGIDYDDAFVPLSCIESIGILLTLAAQEGWRVHHMDVKFAFLNGDLKEEVYVRQPPRLHRLRARGQGAPTAQGLVWNAVGAAGLELQAG
jgi:hypothetical protein